jgi:hypothetical protein
MEIVDQTLVGIASQVHERIAILMKYNRGIQRAQARKSSITNQEKVSEFEIDTNIFVKVYHKKLWLMLTFLKKLFTL